MSKLPRKNSDLSRMVTPVAGFGESAQRALLPLAAGASVDDLRSRGFSNDEIYAIVAPRRTLARRVEKAEALSIGEADRVQRLQRISDMADRVFGSHEKANRWLRSNIIALGGARPIDFLVSERGAREIEYELHRIDHGMLA